jgi:hypothetical protein
VSSATPPLADVQGLVSRTGTRGFTLTAQRSIQELLSNDCCYSALSAALYRRRAHPHLIPSLRCFPLATQSVIEGTRQRLVEVANNLIVRPEIMRETLDGQLGTVRFRSKVAADRFDIGPAFAHGPIPIIGLTDLGAVFRAGGRPQYDVVRHNPSLARVVGTCLPGPAVAP